MPTCSVFGTHKVYGTYLAPLCPFPARTLMWLKQLCFLQDKFVNTIMHNQAEHTFGCDVVEGQMVSLDGADGTKDV